jgi:RNA polymerase sigma-70 factor (ECF subfamily)
MNSISDSQVVELIAQAREGDNEAVVRLLELYRSYVHLLARLQIDRRLQGKASASDVAQETFLRAKKYFAQFRGASERELLVWLRRNLASTMARMTRHYTAQKRDVNMERQLDERLEASSHALGRLPVVDSPSVEARRREASVLLADALAQLDAAYREVIVLRHLENLSFPEVAQRMGRTLDSVKNIWARAVSELRHMVGELE